MEVVLLRAGFYGVRGEFGGEPCEEDQEGDGYGEEDWCTGYANIFQCNVDASGVVS